ncbi:MAG: AAA family ATPase [Symploca sp. SIO3C6]|nr:AAA family ATPase [Symploca sp. SIO3C6]
MFQSEIRKSEINSLLEKVTNQSYGKYLLKINMVKARAFCRGTISLDFPVTALLGPNGGGKTTVLGAAACAYKAIKPSTFFAKSGRFDSSMENWKFEYEAIDRSVKSNDITRRTATFTRRKWNRDGLDRCVKVFGVSRTVPANERPELKRCISSKFDVNSDSVLALSQQFYSSVASILDKDISQFSFIKVDDKGKISLLAGQTKEGSNYSEFHFGAGESSVIRMIIVLESIEENSLVLIEEIENGLHPVAAVRMVEYLITLATRKKIQVLFTTHSNDALKPLPKKAVWVAANGRLYQGKLNIASLRAITGQIRAKLTVFVEDEFARLWVKSILHSINDITMEAISIHSMEGDGTAVRVHLDHNLNPSIKNPSICIVDGDSRQQDSTDKKIFRLPGESPESFIYDKILEKIDDISGELAVTLLKPYEKETEIKDVIRSIRNTNRDPHLLYSQVGKRLGLIPELRVKEAFITL